MNLTDLAHLMGVEVEEAKKMLSNDQNIVVNLSERNKKKSEDHCSITEIV